MSASGIASPPMRSRELLARVLERAVRDQSRSTPRDRNVDASPSPICPRRSRARCAPSSVAEVLGRDRDRGRRDRHRMAADAGLGAHALARLDRVPEQPREHCGAVPSRTAACHASRTWPRISLSPTIIESRPGRDREQVRDRGVVVVRVEVVGEARRGRRRSSAARKSRDVADRGVEVRAARVDLGAVARGEHHDLEQVLARREVVQHLRRAAPRAPSSARAARPARCGGSDRRRSETRAQAAPSPRRCARRGPGPRCRNRTPVANRRPRCERPDGPQRFPGLGEQVEQGLVLRADLLVQAPPEVRRRAPGCGRRCRSRPRGRPGGPPTSA